MAQRKKRKSANQKLVEALIQSSKMEHLKKYLERGRIYESLSDAELEARWVDAHNAYLGDGDSSRALECDELSAEYSIRDKEEPHHLVADASKKAGKRIAKLRPEYLEKAKEGIKEFMESLEKPKN